MKNIELTVVMRCSVCGNDQFESLDIKHDDSPKAPIAVKFRCSDCGAFYTKDELIAENTEAIEIAKDEITEEAMKEFDYELRRVMNNWKF